MDNQFVQVIDAYMKPKCHSADSDAVRRALALFQVNHSQLHQICAQYFDWAPDKTDEYILPKIAERNLRIFANLRSTSSELEVHLPIHEMPAKCPVSRIVKQRKVLGRDYFEVSWEDMDGLETSVVPDDLVESACPEKIVEFHQVKAQQKKPIRKPRQKKQESMKEIDIKLQELLIDIDKESTTLTVSHILRGTAPEMKNDAPASRQKKVDTRADMKEIERKLQDLLTDIEKENTRSTNIVSQRGKIDNGSKEGGTSNGGSLVSGWSATADVINLISLAPRLHTHDRELSKSKEARRIDVVELSDTDNDVSPQHARKMRELKLYMASIRDDIC